MAYEVIISRGIRSCPMLKCSSDRCVCAPQSLSAGTSTAPRLSVSVRMSDICITPCSAENTISSRLCSRRHIEIVVDGGYDRHASRPQLGDRLIPLAVDNADERDDASLDEDMNRIVADRLESEERLGDHPRRVHPESRTPAAECRAHRPQFVVLRAIPAQRRIAVDCVKHAVPDLVVQRKRLRGL